ncbi:RteC domain-containing protein [Flavobacterium sp.]|uniref:RteC domain-containing protein n=1 Tax=Flavobacterium sp. TaxID=239 RepID=UPI004048D5F4
MIASIKNNSLLDFEHELCLILNTYSDEVEKAKKIIIFIEDTLKQLTNWLKNHVFETIQEEIKFFKEIKPNIVAKLIFYKEIISLVATLPLDKNKRLKHYEKKIDVINQFHRKNREFIKYIKSHSTHFDELYFSRKQYKDLFLNDCMVINQDAKLCTSHDYLMAEVIAYELLALHIENRIDTLNQSCAITTNQISSNLHWTAKKIDLIELIYALHEAKVFDNGQADIKEITHVFEKAFQIDLGDNITRSFIDIKNRKTDQTRFLNQLQATLETKIENDLN